MYEFDGISLDGFPEISPFGIDGPVDSSPADKTVTLVDNPVGDGSTLAGLPQLQNITREIPLEIYRRFTSAITNMHVNPSFEKATTGGTALGAAAIALDTTESKDGGTSLRVTSTAAANDGVAIAFAATVAPYSTSIWVFAPAGAPMAIKYDGGVNQAFVGTGAWQLVKLENKTLTATGRFVQVIQTDATARTFLVDAVCTTQSATAQYFFCGDSGDAKWTGTPHASTSTTLVGEAAVGFALGVLSQKARRAEALSQLGGIPVRYRPGDCPFRGTSNVITAKLTDWPYDVERAVGRATGKITLTQLGGIQGPEYKLTTLSKLAGVYAIDSMLPAAKGDAPGPMRGEFTNRDAIAWRFLQMGIEQRYASATTPRLVLASSMTVLAPSTTSAAVNQSITLTKTGTVSGGSGNLYIGDIAFAIASGTLAAAVQTAIAALNGIGSGNVTVTGGPLSSVTPMVITFLGALAGVPINLRWDTTGLTGGGSVAGVVTAGVPATINSVVHRGTWTDLGYIDVDLIGDYEVLAVGGRTSTGSTAVPQLRMTTAAGDAQPAIGRVSPAKVYGPDGPRLQVSLGEAHFSKIARGTQSTRVRIQGKTSAFKIEALIFQPVGLAGVRANSQPAAVTRYYARDTFSSGSSGALNGFTADTLQAWATSGSATDLQVSGSAGTVSRSTVSDVGAGAVFGAVGREAVLTVAHSWSLARLKYAFSANPVGVTLDARVFLNWVNSTNYVVASVNGSDGNVSITVVVGGVSVAASTGSVTPDTAQHQLEVATLPTGRVELTIDGITVCRVYTNHLLPGGALVNGARFGWVDRNASASACTRTFDEPELLEIRDLAVVNPSRIIDVRAPFPLTESAAGGAFAPTDGVRIGSDPMLPPAGVEGLQCRLVATWNRENPDIAPWDYVGPGDLDIWHTPVYDVQRWEQ